MVNKPKGDIKEELGMWAISEPTRWLVAEVEAQIAFETKRLSDMDDEKKSDRARGAIKRMEKILGDIESLRKK